MVTPQPPPPASVSEFVKLMPRADLEKAFSKLIQEHQHQTNQLSTLHVNCLKIGREAKTEMRTAKLLLHRRNTRIQRLEDRLSVMTQRFSKEKQITIKLNTEMSRLENDIRRFTVSLGKSCYLSNAAAAVLSVLEDRNRRRQENRQRILANHEKEEDSIEEVEDGHVQFTAQAINEMVVEALSI